MRLIIIILLFVQCSLSAQQKSTIILGDGSGTPVSGVSDSMGLVIPQGEIVIGTSSKAPGSSDSLLWNAGLFVDAPLNLTGLAAGALDSMLYIDASGFVGKTAVVSGSDSLGRNGTAGRIVLETATKAGTSDDGFTWDATNHAVVLDMDGASTGSFSWIRDASVTQLKIEKVGTVGAIIDINPKTLDGTSQTSFRFFRETNTSGAVFFDIMVGDNTNTTNARLAGNAGAHTFLAANNGRVGIGTSSPATSAILDVNSTTGALLLPRMTTAQRDALTGVDGMQIYNTTTGKFQGRAGGAWVDLH